MAPLLYMLLKKTSWILPAVLGLVYITGDLMLTKLFWKPEVFFFFCLGSCFALRKIDWISLVNSGWSFLIYIALYVVMLFAFMSVDNRILLNISVLFGFPVLISLTKLISKMMPGTVAQKYVIATFFIYLYHYYIACFMWRPLAFVLGTTEASLFFAYFGGGILTVLFLYVAYYLTDKYFHRLVSVIVGGR